MLRKRALSAAAVVLGILLAVGIGEPIARRFYQPPWYDKLVAEQYQNNFEIRYQTEAYGLRDKVYPVEKPSDHRRVMILGDSFTFGHGVFRDEDIFPEILERRLNDELSLPSVKQFDVLNAALSGTLTSDWLSMLETLAPRFSPDVVLVVFFLRDGTTLSAIESFFGPIRKQIAERNRQSRLYSHLYLFRIIRDRIDQLAISRRYSDAFHRSYFGNEADTREWKSARQNLRKIQRLCHRNGVVFGMAVYPILIELDEDYPFRAEVDAVVEFALSSEMPVLNLLPAFQGQDAADLWVSPYDQHANERGHAIAAEAIFPFLCDLIVEAGRGQSADRPNDSAPRASVHQP